MCDNTGCCGPKPWRVNNPRRRKPRIVYTSIRINHDRTWCVTRDDVLGPNGYPVSALCTSVRAVKSVLTRWDKRHGTTGRFRLHWLDGSEHDVGTRRAVDALLDRLSTQHSSLRTQDSA